MIMATRCPACGTLFKVTEEQLKARQGQVRCGRCMTVFDGGETLNPVPGEEQAAAARREERAVTAASPVITAPPEEEHRLVSQQLSLDDEYLAVDARARRAPRLWAVGVALLTIVLAGQGAYFYRADLAVRFPALKPSLVKACEMLHCRVLPPQQPRQIAIEASDLQVADPTHPGVIRLTATLRNHAGHDLAYPALDLVLTNTQEHTLARRIFLPRDYLARGNDIVAGIPANAEITVRLDLNTGDLNPAGYRLDLLPAPQP